MVAVLMACSAHLFKLVPLRAAALSATACISALCVALPFHWLACLLLALAARAARSNHLLQHEAAFKLYY